MKIPEFNATGNASDLIDWYKKLGWNPKTHTIDPVKVKVSTETNKLLMEKFSDAFPEETKIHALIFWMNSGPSVKDMPNNEVILEEGWLIPD